MTISVDFGAKPKLKQTNKWFSTDRVCSYLSRLNSAFGDSGGIMTTARLELPYPRSSDQAKTREQTYRRGKYIYIFTFLLQSL